MEGIRNFYFTLYRWNVRAKCLPLIGKFLSNRSLISFLNMASVKEIMTRCVNILTEAAILLLDDRSWESESGAVALLSPTVGPRLTSGDIYTALTQHQSLAIAHLREQAHREELLTPWKIRKFNFISSSCQMWKQLRSWRLRLFNGQLVSQKYHFEVKTPLLQL